METAASSARVAPRRLYAAALVLGAAGSIQLGAAVATTLFDEVGPAGTVLPRLLFAAAILLALWRPALRGRPPGTWPLVAGLGVAVAGLNLSFYSAIARAPLGIVATLAFVGPLGVAVASSRRLASGLWILLAGAGVVLLSPGTGGSLDTLAAALAVLAGGFWAAYILLAAGVGRAFAGGRGLALATAVAALIALPGGVASGGSALVRGEVLAIGAAVAILSTAIPYSLELEALRHLPPGTFGVLMSLQPAVAALVGFLVLGQDLSASEVLAIALVVAASAGALGTVRGPPPVEA